jgi:hypothetical protein
MSEIIGSFIALPCADSPDMGNQLRQTLKFQRADASALGQSAVDTVERGSYTNTSGLRIALAPSIERSKEGTRSIKPEDPLHYIQRSPVTRCMNLIVSAGGLIPQIG